MSTFRLLVSYDGAPFHGFARQPGLETVQGRLEEGLEKILGGPVQTSAAGRTDAGVHALGQVVSFHVDRPIDPTDLVRRMNALCAPSIVVLEASEAPEGFDARFSALSRTYEYGILNRELPDPFSRHTTWHVSEPLQTDLMSKAAQALLGEHSFESFGRVEQGQSPIRRIESIDITTDGELVSIQITANSFVQQMVRSIVGTLVKVGQGKIHPDDMDGILHARDRSKAGPVAPPHGLFLVHVLYPSS